ncbi:hypothetical protein ACJX0J_017148 [Zea mays]
MHCVRDETHELLKLIFMQPSKVLGLVLFLWNRCLEQIACLIYKFWSTKGSKLEEIKFFSS